MYVGPLPPLKPTVGSHVTTTKFSTIFSVISSSPGRRHAQCSGPVNPHFCLSMQAPNVLLIVYSRRCGCWSPAATRANGQMQSVPVVASRMSMISEVASSVVTTRLVPMTVSRSRPDGSNSLTPACTRYSYSMTFACLASPSVTSSACSSAPPPPPSSSSASSSSDGLPSLGWACSVEGEPWLSSPAGTSSAAAGEAAAASAAATEISVAWSAETVASTVTPRDDMQSRCSSPDSMT